MCVCVCVYVSVLYKQFLGSCEHSISFRFSVRYTSSRVISANSILGKLYVVCITYIPWDFSQFTSPAVLRWFLWDFSQFSTSYMYYT